jgi:small-conductance mechanosensitive channel
VRAALVALLLPAALAARAEPPAARAAVKVDVGAPAPVVVWNREVVVLRARIGDVGPAERAERVRRRIEEIPPEALGSAVEVVPIEISGARLMLLSAGGRQLVALAPQDVDPDSGATLADHAAATASRLQDVLRARAEARRLPRLLRGIVASVVATLILVFVLAGAFRLHARAVRHVAASSRRSFFGVEAAHVVGAVRRIGARLALFAAIAVASYAWLAFVLIQFPYTQPWGAGLGAYLRALLGDLARGAAASLPGLFAALVIFLLTRFVSGVVNGIFQGVEAGRMEVPWLDADTARATRRIVSALIWVFAITVAYPYIPGSETGVFKGISVFVGLVLTIGSSGIVNQMMSGILLVYARAFRPGDYVKLGEDLEGTVTQVGLLSTKLISFRREEITVPNAVLVASPVRNLTRLASDGGMLASTKVTIGYDAPWRQVHALLLQAAAHTPGVRREPAPRVVQRSLEDFYVEYELLVRLERPEGRPLVLSELHARIQDTFNEGGVQIMSPHFEGQPEKKVVVPRDEWHAAPAESDPRGADGQPPSVTAR